jgi:hypothetical protein
LMMSIKWCGRNFIKFLLSWQFASQYPSFYMSSVVLHRLFARRRTLYFKPFKFDTSPDNPFFE